MARVRSVEGNSKTNREIPFEISGVVTDQMCAVFVDDARRNLFEQARSLEQFHTQGSSSVIVGRQQSEPPHCVAPNHARKQVEVILDHARMDRLGGNVGESGSWLGEKQKQKK